MKTIELTKELFAERVADIESVRTNWRYLGDKPALIDFYSATCSPCRAISPILDELAAEYAQSVVIYKVNTANEPEITKAFGIHSLPTIIFIPIDSQPQMSEGAMMKSDFRAAIDRILLEIK